MAHTVPDLAALVRERRPCVVLTGAGISTESGIPDFRSPDGIWAEYDPLEFATIDAFRRDPVKVWEFYAPRFELLTTREGEVLELVAAGLTNAGIAERLWISPGTVKKHLDNVYAKLGVTNRAAAVAARPGRGVTGDSRHEGSPSGRAS